MSELWIKLSDTGWGYRPGHSAAHFMKSGSNAWYSLCGQVIMTSPYLADINLKKCGRCERALANHPEWGKIIVTGTWAPAVGSFRQHQWLWDGARNIWVSRCGVVRSGDAVGEADMEILIAEGKSSGRDLPDCKKCLDYLGIDERKRPEKVALNDEGRTVSVKMMAGTKPVYNIEIVSDRRIKMSEKNEAKETKEIRFDFTIKGMRVEEAKILMSNIREFISDIGLKLGGGFYPYKDEPDPRDTVVEAARAFVPGAPPSTRAQATLKAALDALEASDVKEK